MASQVAVTAGETDKSRYRRFKIKSVPGQDDFASMYEVLHRRVKRGHQENDLPDLIVVDGGKGQLASAHAALKDLGAQEIDLVGLAKSRDLPVDNPDLPTAKSPERVFLVNRKDPLVLPQNSPELFMLTRIRDEAHRFAITFQQNLMRKRSFRIRSRGHSWCRRGTKKSAPTAFWFVEASSRGLHRGVVGGAGA